MSPVSRCAYGLDGPLLIRRQLPGTLGLGGGEARYVPTAHATSGLDAHDAPLCERAHRARASGQRHRKLCHAQLPVPEGGQDEALPARVGARLEVPRSRRERHPALVHRTAPLDHQLPGIALFLAPDPHGLTRRKKGTDRIGQRAGILARDPLGHAHRVLVEGGLCEYAPHGKDPLEGKTLGRLILQIDDIAHDVSVRERHEYRRTDRTAPLEPFGHEVVEGMVYGTGGYVRHDGREAHEGHVLSLEGLLETLGRDW